MGISGSSHKKTATMLDSDDTDSMTSSSSSMRLDNMTENDGDEVQVDKDTLLDQSLDALYEKRYSFNFHSCHIVLLRAIFCSSVSRWSF